MKNQTKKKQSGSPTLHRTPIDNLIAGMVEVKGEVEIKEDKGRPSTPSQTKGKSERSEKPSQIGKT
jgi:hypothetical protein